MSNFVSLMPGCASPRQLWPATRLDAVVKARIEFDVHILTTLVPYSGIDYIKSNYWINKMLKKSKIHLQLFLYNIQNKDIDLKYLKTNKKNM